MEPPKVLIVSNRAEIVGGGEISMLLLLEGLLSTGTADPVLAVPGEGVVGKKAGDLGVPVIEVGMPGLRTRPWVLPRLRREAKNVIGEVAPRLVHANGARAMLIVGAAATGMGLPVVWHVRVQGKDILDRPLARKCSRIVVPSRTVGDRFPTEKVNVIPNPVPIPAANRGDECIRQLRAEYAAEDEHLLIAVGEVGPHKGYSRLFEALSISEHLHRWRMLVLGADTPDFPHFRGDLERYIEKAGLDERIQFLGFREDASDLMLAADLLIHAPDSEGFGRVFIEAMAAGLPLVSIPVGGLAELHVETGYGWLAEDLSAAALSRAIDRALHEKEERERFSRIGPGLAAGGFSVEVHANRIAAVYADILDGGE